MVDQLHFKVLDDKRKKILPQLISLKDRFYLAGGTALALQLGHRSSIDFDFFSQIPFDNLNLYIEIEEILVLC
jgi:hypothetical protein